MALTITGERLKNWAAPASSFQRRSDFPFLLDFLENDPDGRVFILYGLRRTGKTTMMQQAVMDCGDPGSCAYFLAGKNDGIDDILDRIFALRENGVTRIFIDEATAIDGFMESANALSDVLAREGIHIILAGTDSLGFHFGVHDTLYDRAHLLHTTTIPFEEHARLLGTHDLDGYITQGGILGDSFSGYISDAVVGNVCNTLMRIGKFGFLAKGMDGVSSPDILRRRLSSVVHKVVNDENHRFLKKIFLEDFGHPDFVMGRRMLSREERKALAGIDLAAMLEKVEERLHLGEDLSGISKEEIREVARLLYDMGLILPRMVTGEEMLEIMPKWREMEQMTDTFSSVPGEQCWVFTQPGLRWSQTVALTETLRDVFPLDKRTFAGPVIERMKTHARGHILEDIIVSETCARFGNRGHVLKYRPLRSEIDMVVVDDEGGFFDAWEIKYAKDAKNDPARHLKNGSHISFLAEKLCVSPRKLGVIHMGRTWTNPCDIGFVFNGEKRRIREISFVNAADFLVAGLYGPWPKMEYRNREKNTASMTASLR